MIFVVEHERGGIWQIEVVSGVEDLDTSQYQPIKKIFLCENADESAAVIRELHEQRFNKGESEKYGERGRIKNEWHCGRCFTKCHV